MFQTYTPAESATIWMRFTPAPAEETVVAEAVVCADVTSETPGVETAPVDKRITNEIETVDNPRKKTAGVHISSVDTQSQLTRCEYHRDSIRVGKRLCSLSSLS